jgi:PPM family protein phosphatase
MSTTSFPELEIGASTDPGRKRAGEANQDAILSILPEQGRPSLFIVADGMGGYAGGAMASKIVVEAIAARYREEQHIQDLPALLRDCLLRAWHALEDGAAENPDLVSMGSTAVLAVLDAGQVTVANIGDSRAYLLHPLGSPASVKPAASRSFLSRIFSGKRPPSDQTAEDIATSYDLKQISYDHSEVAALVRAGALTPLEALQSPLKNRLTQSLSPRRKDIDPFIGQVPFGAEDVLLLCTDGLWGVVPEATIATIALELSPQKATDKLVQQAINFGGPDNISVIIARQHRDPVGDGDKTSPGD